MIIVFGGSFNPPTLAHFQLAKLVLKEPGVSKVVWIPVGDDYGKPDLISCHHRLAMCERLLEAEPQMCLSDIECYGDLAKGSYHTLSALQKQVGEEPLAFLVGADHFMTLPKWIEAKKLLQEFNIWIVPRPGYPVDHDLKNQIFFREYQEQLRFLIHFPLLPMSASEVRMQIKAGVFPKGLVHPRVWEYISQEGLYGV